MGIDPYKVCIKINKLRKMEIPHATKSISRASVYRESIALREASFAKIVTSIYKKVHFSLWFA